MGFLLDLLLYAAAALCLGAFLLAAGSALRMVRHRAPGVSRWTLATQGIRFYTGRGFTPAAEAHRRRFLRAALAFAAGLLLLAAAGIGKSTLSP